MCCMKFYLFPRRINAITGYQTSLKYDRFGEGKVEAYEALQVR